jgi:ferredoxin
MPTGLLLDIVLQEDQRTPRFSGLCKRLRFSHSDCQRCVDICPENAITLDPGPSINDRCSSCGLCQTACPTEVFQGEIHTDQHLLSQITPFPGKDEPVVKERRLFVHCQQAEKQNETSFSIPCLGSITENFILGVALSGANELALTKGACSECRLKQGEQLLTNSIAAFDVLSKTMELQQFTLNLQEKQKEEQATLSRRALFSSISGGQENRAESALSPKDEAIGTSSGRNPPQMTNGTRPSPKREFLRSILDKTPPNRSAVVAYEQSFPWGNVKIDEKNCVTCGICVNVCPTGAIYRKTKNEQLSHYFNASLCTNCRLCEEACPQKVISFEQDFLLTDVLKNEANAITRINLNACMICGEVIPAREGEICTTCDKRQMSSRFVGL